MTKLIVDADDLKEGQNYGKGGVRDDMGFTSLYRNPRKYDDDLAQKKYEAEKSRNYLAAEKMRAEQKRLENMTSQNLLEAERQKRENFERRVAYEKEQAEAEAWGKIIGFGIHLFVNREYYWYKTRNFVRQVKALKDKYFPADHVPKCQKIIEDTEMKKQAEKPAVTEIERTVWAYAQDADNKEVRMHLMLMVYHHMEAAKHLKAASGQLFPEDPVMRERFEQLATERVLECINTTLSQDIDGIEAEIIQEFCSMLGRDSLTDENGVYVPIQLWQLRNALNLDPVAT